VSDDSDRSADHASPASHHTGGRASEGSHLSHWPPPQRQHEHKAKIAIKVPVPDEPADHAKWHLTRGIASKFGDDERD
jgi:hypothetical protein